tara:strand:- start:708 stop:899 length:192 start_codon:yes stop_codon:yes gene_type:complete
MTSKETDRELVITPEYVNNKMESMLAAFFDTLEETETRMKNLEKRVYELTQELKDAKESETKE